MKKGIRNVGRQAENVKRRKERGEERKKSKA